MLPRSLLLLTALVSLLPASASTLQEASGGFVTYQFDGDGHHDAPDTCADASPEWSAPLGGTTDGLLAPPDDMADVFLLEVPHASVGRSLVLEVAQADGMPDLALTAFAPGCQGSVLDLANWPSPEPSPPAPAPGERQHSADVSSPYHCDGDQWLFVIDRLQGIQEPASIHLAWTDGTEAPVALTGRYGNFALYATDHNLGILLKGAWANVAASWDGSLIFAAGPCDAVHGGAVYGAPPVLGDSFLVFTPVRAGAYIVHVSLEQGAVGPLPAPASLDPSPFVLVDPEEAASNLDADGLAHDPLGWLQSPPGPESLTDQVPSLSVPATCHICLGQVEGLAKTVSYVIGSSWR